MRDVKEKIYDDMYGHKEIYYEPPSGIIGFLYKRLRKFEVNRYYACLNLLPSDQEKLLDVGCGSGDFIFMAKDKYKECYGVDISGQRIEQATKKVKGIPNQEKVHFFKCDVDKELPFPDKYFDTITCIAVLEHLFNPPTVVEEINRVLKIGGIFIVQVPNIAWIPYRIQLLLGKLPTTGGVYLGADWEHLHNFTKSTISLLLIEKGFEINSISCSGIFAKCRKLWPAVLGGDLII